MQGRCPVCATHEGFRGLHLDTLRQFSRVEGEAYPYTANPLMIGHFTLILSSCNQIRQMYIRRGTVDDAYRQDHGRGRAGHRQAARAADGEDGCRSCCA
jgi:hypothetical protein